MEVNRSCADCKVIGKRTTVFRQSVSREDGISLGGFVAVAILAVNSLRNATLQYNEEESKSIICNSFTVHVTK
jgi:hypothetical protein